MRKLIYILFVLILVSCNSKLSDRYVAKANELRAEGRYAEAIVFLDKAINRNPQNIYALLDRGADKSLLGDYRGAIKDYSKVIEIDSTNTLAFLNRGKNKTRLGHYTLAIEDFNKAIRTKGGENFWFEREDNFFSNRSPFDVPMEAIRFERGIARFNADSLQLALADFYFCVARAHLLSESYYKIGLIYLAYGYDDEACEVLLKAFAHGNSDARELLNEYCVR